MTKHVYRISTLALAGLVALIGLTGSASAAKYENAWELGITFPYTMFDDPSSYDSLDDAIGYGVRGGYIFKGGHEVEFNMNLTSTTDDVRLPFGGTASVDIDFTNYTFGYLYNFTKNDRFTPFVTAGFGWSDWDAGDLGSETDSQYYAGGGIRFNFAKNMNVRIDGLWQQIQTDPESLNNWVLGVGLGWLLGGK